MKMCIDRFALRGGRSHIRTESEWYFVQHRLDEIEGGPHYQEEDDKLQALMENYHE